MTRLFVIAAAAAVSIAACAEADDRPGRPAIVNPRDAAQPTPSFETSAAVTEQSVRSAEALAPNEAQEAAAVSQLHLMPEIDAKLFSLSGGDPAVNGLVTYLALFRSSSEGWRLYPVGDLAQWTVAESGPGMVRIDFRQDTAGPDGDILKRAGQMVVEWTLEPDGSPPAAVAVATVPPA